MNQFSLNSQIGASPYMGGPYYLFIYLLFFLEIIGPIEPLI